MAPLLVALLVASVGAVRPTDQIQSPPSACEMERSVRDARLSLHAAENAFARGDYRTADKLSKKGLERLSDDYALPPTPPSMIDDTGMHLMLAEDADRKGSFKLAASIRQRGLRERLEIYDQYHRPRC